MRADFLANEQQVDRWEPSGVDEEVKEWARAMVASGALRDALDAVGREDPELESQSA